MWETKYQEIEGYQAERKCRETWKIINRVRKTGKGKLYNKKHNRKAVGK